MSLLYTFITIFPAQIIGFISYSYAFFIVKKINPKAHYFLCDFLLRTLFLILLCYISFGKGAPYSIYFSAYYKFATQLFISALFVSCYTDLKTLLISRTVTLYLIPLIWLASYLNFIPISLPQSILGTICGYAFLWITAKIAYYFYKQEAIGLGDIELLAFIGSFLGPISAWNSLLYGSIIGSLSSLLYLFITKQNNTRLKIPFGLFLSLGALIAFLL